MDEGFADLAAFAAVASTGSFKAAAAQLGRDASIVSRRITGLERRLGVRLLVRTTRSVSLTEAGTFYFKRVRAAFDELDAASREVGDFAATPQGILKISLPVTYGRKVIAPLIPEFLTRYPRIQIDAHFLDRFVDIVSERFDLVIRIGAVQDSSLMARKLGSFRSVFIASPSYVARNGLPDSPEGLASHACLGFTNHPDWPNWVVENDGELRSVRPQGPFVANSSESILVAACKGAGIALSPSWMAAPHLKTGELLEILPGWRSAREIFVHVVMPPGALVPAKTRVFVDEISAALRLPTEG